MVPRRAQSLPNGARASLASGDKKALASPWGCCRHVSHRVFWGQVSRCSSPTSWGARSGGESAKSGCLSAGRSTGWMRRGRRKCWRPLTPPQPLLATWPPLLSPWVGGRSCFPAPSPPDFAIMGSVGSDLAALPRSSKNQWDFGVGKKPSANRGWRWGFLPGQLPAGAAVRFLEKMCPFTSGRIVSLLSKFRLGFHEVHILPDINQKPRPEQ